MEIEKIIKSISKERFKPYMKRYPNDLEKSLRLYQANIEVSQAFYSSLSILEIALRNTINNSFTVHFKSDNWRSVMPAEIIKQIEIVEIQLQRSKKEISQEKIISELNFGFWTTLFNRKYAKFLWKPLMKSFPNLPKEYKKRAILSSKLNHIRTFRNRIYHYDPIIWEIQEIINKRKEIIDILNWIEPETCKWALKMDQFEEVKVKIKQEL